jgi:cell division protein FtsB
MCIYHNGDLYLCYYARVINPLFYSQYLEEDIANIDARDKELVEKAKQDMERLSAEIAELQAQVDELTAQTKKDIV